MAKGREYAEGLVGPLDRSYYETQRNVSKQTSETNWQDLQNQYKNLQAKLKMEQEQANRNFANGLVQVAENSLDRMNSANDAMAMQGLSISGLNNIMQQADTTRKGEEVLDLLGTSGDVAVNIANQLSSANTTAAKKQADLADALSSALGDIGAGETNAQMAYNQGLANIGEAMEAREAENDLAAKQRAANAASSGRSKELKKWEDDLDELYRRAAIMEALNSDELTDEEKGTIIGTLYNVKESANAVKAHNAYSKNTQYAEDLKNAEKELEKAKKVPGAYKKEAQSLYEFVNNGKDTGSSEHLKAKNTLKKYIDGDQTISQADAMKAYKRLKGNGTYNIEAKNTIEAIDKLYRTDFSKSSEQAKIDEISENMRMRDLAELLYGNK